MRDHNYYVYITTNKNKTVLYTGFSGNIPQRTEQHEEVVSNNRVDVFTGRYNACFVVYFEHHRDARTAIAREKEIKGWRREKKIALINAFNPEWRFLNEDLKALRD